MLQQVEQKKQTTMMEMFMMQITKLKMMTKNKALKDKIEDKKI